MMMMMLSSNIIVSCLQVLLVGGQEFTLIGRPILRRSLVKVEATVIEKTPNADQVIQYFIPRKSFQRRYSE